MSVSSRRNANFRKMRSVEKNVRSGAKIKTCLSKEREARSFFKTSTQGKGRESESREGKARESKGE